MFVNESEDEFFNFDDGSSCGNMATSKIECLRYLDEAHSSSLNVLSMPIQDIVMSNRSSEFGMIQCLHQNQWKDSFQKEI